MQRSAVKRFRLRRGAFLCGLRFQAGFGPGRRHKPPRPVRGDVPAVSGIVRAAHLLRPGRQETRRGSALATHGGIPSGRGRLSGRSERLESTATWPRWWSPPIETGSCRCSRPWRAIRRSSQGERREPPPPTRPRGWKAGRGRRQRGRTGNYWRLTIRRARGPGEGRRPLWPWGAWAVGAPRVREPCRVRLPSNHIVPTPS